MGTLDKFFELNRGTEADITAPVYICADGEEIRRLRDQGAKQLAGADMYALTPDAVLPLDEFAGGGLVVLQVDPAHASSVQRLADLRQKRPDLPVVVALRESDVGVVRTLLRRGVSDVVSLPFDSAELVESLHDVAAKAAPSAPVSQGTMTALVRSSGGVGATTVLTHLAAEMAERSGRKGSICLIDLDVQSGDAASYLGLNPSTGIGDLMDAGESVDEDVLRVASVDSGHGFRLVAAPREIAPLEVMDVDQLLRVLQLARQKFDHVLVDLPAGWTNWSLSAALACSRVLFLTDNTVASLRQTKRRIELLQSMDIERDALGVVVNRAEKKLFQTIGAGEVEATLKIEVLAMLAADEQAMRQAQEEGVLVSKVNRRSKFARDIEGLAAFLLGTED